MANKFSKETNIDTTKESFLALMKQIYDDAEAQKETAIYYISRFTNMIGSELEDEDGTNTLNVNMVAKHINDQQKTIDTAIKTKVDLLKLQSTILFSGAIKKQLEESSEIAEEIKELDDNAKAAIITNRTMENLNFDLDENE